PAAAVPDRFKQLRLRHLAATADLHLPGAVVDLVAAALFEASVRIACTHRPAIRRSSLGPSALVDSPRRDLLCFAVGHTALLSALLDVLEHPLVFVAPGLGHVLSTSGHALGIWRAAL